MIRQLLFSACLLGFLQSSVCSEITFLNSIQQTLRTPSGVDVGPDGTLYVADLGNQRIALFDPVGTLQRTSFTFSPRDIGASPAIVQNRNGSTTRPVFVVDRDNNQIRRFSEVGVFEFEFGSLGMEDGQLNRPLGLDVNQIGDVFVADTDNNRIQRFDINGIFQGTFGTMGTGVGQFDAPTDVAIGLNDEIYVADRNNNRVQKFDNAGNFIFALGGFDDPTSLAVSEAGHLYVADRDNNRILRFGAGGALQETFGGLGNGIFEFEMPLGVAVSPSGLVYVADSGNRRVPRYFDSDAWVRGRNEFTNTSTGPVNVGVGSESLFFNENFTRVSLGKEYVLNTLMELVVGRNTRIVEDGILTIAGGELSTDTLQIEGLLEFESGRLEIRNGGISLGNDGPFGDELLVGFKSSVALGDDLIVGETNDARMRIQRGGTVENANGRVAVAEGTLSSVQVSGFGSSWSNLSELSIGQAGRGSMQVTDGGFVKSDSASLGESAANAQGQVAISGFGSTWENTADLQIGEMGRGQLSITEGGQASSGSASIGASNQSNGFVLVTGLGSTWSNTGAMGVGRLGVGALSIADGGAVSSDSIQLGFEQVTSGGNVVQGDGTIVVSGFGSRLTVQDAPAAQLPLVIGSAGQGELRVVEQGYVASNGAAIGANGGFGKVVVAGVGSVWSNAGPLELVNGQVDVLDGGAIEGVTGLALGNGQLNLARSGMLVNGSAEATANGADISLSDASLEIAGNFTNKQNVSMEFTVDGRGALRAADWMNEANATMTFTTNSAGSKTDVFGNVTNRGEINVSGGTSVAFHQIVDGAAASIKCGDPAVDFVLFLDAATNPTIAENCGNVASVFPPPAAEGADLSGNWTLLPDAVTTFELRSSSDHDHVAVEGVFAANGTLNIEPGDAYSDPGLPGQADMFRLLTANPIDGLFGAINYAGAELQPTDIIDDASFRSHVGDGFFRTYEQTADDIVFINYQALVGDANGNLEVDFGDFLTLSANFNQTGDWTQGDFDGDGEIQFGDFLLLSANFGQSVSPAAVAAVPEPATSLLGLVAFAFLGLARRRGRGKV